MASSRRDARRGAAIVAVTLMAGCAAMERGDDRMPALLAAAGDSVRGREVFVSREGGHCVLCHAIPGVAVAGNVGPALAGVASRLDAAQIRLRIADISKVNPAAAMPAFHRMQELTRVAPQYVGKPALSGQQVEDLVAFLVTLR